MIIRFKNLMILNLAEFVLESKILGVIPYKCLKNSYIIKN